MFMLCEISAMISRFRLLSLELLLRIAMPPVLDLTGGNLKQSSWKKNELGQYICFVSCNFPGC
jgi:hypothetical protein